MKGKKRWAAELGFFALVVAATAYGLFHGSDLDELLRLVGTAPLGLVAAGPGAGGTVYLRGVSDPP